MRDAKFEHSQQQNERCIQSYELQPRERGDVRALLWKTATVTGECSTFYRATFEQTTLNNKTHQDNQCA